MSQSSSSNSNEVNVKREEDIDIEQHSSSSATKISSSLPSSLVTIATRTSQERLSLLPYHQEILKEILESDDSLLILSRGLSIDLVLVKFLRIIGASARFKGNPVQQSEKLRDNVQIKQNEKSAINSSSSNDTNANNNNENDDDDDDGLIHSDVANKRHLVFVVNASHETAVMLRRLCKFDGVPWDEMPIIVNSKTFPSPNDRRNMYKLGGVYIITARILVVDMLQKIVDPNDITGMIVYDAHEIMNIHNVRFAAHIFNQSRFQRFVNGKIKAQYQAREKFIKGFSDSPESFVTGFSVLSQVCSSLGSPKVLLWPRFHSLIRESLDPNKTKMKYPLEVIELRQPLSKAMEEMQSAIIKAIEDCIAELKRSARIDTSQLSVEDSLFKSFDVTLRKQLNPIWHKIGRTAKGLVSDLGVLRRLLPDLLRYDCVTFYSRLLSIQRAAASQQNLPPWMLSDAGEKLFSNAKKRVYSISKAKSSTTTQASELRVNLEINPKIVLLEDILKEIEEETLSLNDQAKKMLSILGGADVLIVVNDDSTAKELNGVLGISSFTDDDQTMNSNNNLDDNSDDAEINLPRSNLCAKIAGNYKTLLKHRFHQFLHRQQDHHIRALEAEIEKKEMAKVLHQGVESAMNHHQRISQLQKKVNIAAASSSSSNPNVISSATANSKDPEWLNNMLSRLNNEQQMLVKECIRLDQLQEEAAIKKSRALQSSSEAFFNMNSVPNDDDVRDEVKMLQSQAIDAITNDREAYDFENDGEADTSYVKIDDDERANETPGKKNKKRSRDNAQTIEEAFKKSQKTQNGEDIEKKKPANELKPKFLVLNRQQIYMIPIRSLGNSLTQVLRLVKPRFIIIYDPNIQVTREIEVYHAQYPEIPLRVYDLQFENSIEEQKNLASLKREQESFSSLIHEKANLVLPTRINIETEASIALRQPATQLPRIIGYNISNGEALVDYGQGVTTFSLKKGQKNEPPSIVIDMREFRSELPSLLHMKSIAIHPVTLEVGDYILSPEVCIERKSIADLFGSFNSGRLYTQVENMRRYYKIPCLLIEFDQSRPFSLQAETEISDDISHASIVTKLVVLTIHFPELRIIWSPSPQSTVDLFIQVKENRIEPNPDTAVKVGVPQIDNDAITATSSSTSPSKPSGSTTLVNQKQTVNHTAIDMLRRFPGVNATNVHKIAGNVKNLRELAGMSLDELTGLIGSTNGTQLYQFLHQRIDNMSSSSTR